MQRYRLRSDITNGIKKQQQTSAHAVLQQPQPQRSCTTDNGEALAVQVTIRVEVEAADFDLFRDYVPDSVSFPPSLLSSFSPKALQFFYYFSRSLTQAPSPQDSPIAQPTACQQLHGDGFLSRGGEQKSAPLEKGGT